MELTTALMVAGTAIQAVGQIQQGNAAKAAADFNAAVARNQAIGARQKATADAARQERESRLRAGAARAAIGASGVTGEGSALDILEANAAQEELDRLTILHGGEMQATGFETSAQLEQMRGAQAQKASRFAAGSTLLLGGATAYGSMGSSSGLTKSSTVSPGGQGMMFKHAGTGWSTGGSAFR